MARVKRGNVHKNRRRNILKQAKGYYGSDSRLYASARDAVDRAMQYAYIGRKRKKRDFRRLCGFLRRAQHGGAAAGVDGQQIHLQPGGSGDGLSNGVRDVVKLQVQEHLRAGAADLADDVRPGADEEFLAHLEGPDHRCQRLAQRECGVGGGNVERGDDGIVHRER